jgi:hypothetical protein
MIRIALVLSLFVCALSLNAQKPQPAQATPPPQTPRQALLEAFFRQGENHLERHLPEAAKKAFGQLDASSPNFLSQLSMMRAQAKAAGNNLQILETGPVLLEAAQSPAEKFEVQVDRDELVGDEDQIDLSFHMFRNGKPEPLPFIPRLTFMMKMEADIWRVNEVAFQAKLPLGDPDFLKDFVKQLQEKQKSSNQNYAMMNMYGIARAETNYHSASANHTFTCSLSELARAAKENTGENRVSMDESLASGQANGYIYALTGCDGAHYKVVAEPATPGAGQRAFCSDESGTVRYAANGKATTCISSGRPINEAPRDGD